jgi:hypothetical protein
MIGGVSRVYSLASLGRKEIKMCYMSERRCTFAQDLT